MASEKPAPGQNPRSSKERKVGIQQSRIFYTTHADLLNNITDPSLNAIILKHDEFNSKNPEKEYCHIFFCEWDIMNFPVWSNWPPTLTSKSFKGEHCDKEWNFELVTSRSEKKTGCLSDQDFQKRNLTVYLHRTDDLDDSIELSFTANIQNENEVHGATDCGEVSFGPEHKSHSLFPNGKCLIHPTNNDLAISGFRMASDILTVKAELKIKICCGGSI